MLNDNNDPIIFTNEPLPITDTTITLEIRKVGKTTYQIPENCSPEVREFWLLMNSDKGGWDALIDAKIREGIDEEQAFLQVVVADSSLKAAFDAAFPNGWQE